ncbi:4Fe-4S single cluster domain-containing protein [Myxococcus sp. AS-1-15]|uniref:4Fe-4S single cluster domain-containing protein n=1 Tax=Myxococcus sp. AS-1-15 TaxID=2874600 RepID=UPI001CBC8970|nr:4Fe-4S single cluster domain-containing protein [Myxococcus sp. AS-1-15]BDT33891.1 4Fe-4S cluster-binding domain-containing protein [Myxococcus sp. MH1]
MLRPSAMSSSPDTSSTGPVLRVAQQVPRTEAEGPGRRFALWVQGCPLRCPGCCNPEMFAMERGAVVTVEAMAARVLATPGIEGLTILGGEPFSQADAVAELCERVRAGGLSTLVFTGYTLAELKAQGRPGVERLLASLDLLVDGRYEKDQPETRRRWIGSRNQVMHFLTPRYAPEDPTFTAPNTAEVHLIEGRIIVNGWPDLADRLRP